MVLGRFKFSYGTDVDYQVAYQGPFDPDFRPLCAIVRADTPDGKWVAKNDRWSTPPCKTRQEAACAILGHMLDEQSDSIEAKVASGWDALRDQDPENALTETEAREVYDLLVRQCRAATRERDHFVYHQTGGRVVEWRFCGVLGFGGKFWCNGQKWYVGAYREDTWPETRLIIAETNLGLLNLFRKFRVETPVLA